MRPRRVRIDDDFGTAEIRKSFGFFGEATYTSMGDGEDRTEQELWFYRPFVYTIFYDDNGDGFLERIETKNKLFKKEGSGREELFQQADKKFSRWKEKLRAGEAILYLYK